MTPSTVDLSRDVALFILGRNEVKVKYENFINTSILIFSHGH